jgi:hypothetical protein
VGGGLSFFVKDAKYSIKCVACVRVFCTFVGGEINPSVPVLTKKWYAEPLKKNEKQSVRN